MILDAAADFWQRVIDGNPPDAVTYADAVHRFGKSGAQGTVVAPPATHADVVWLRSVREQIAALEAKEEEIKGKLIIALGDAGDILIDSSGQALLTYKLGKGQSRLDMKKLEQELPEVYRAYLKTGEPSRKFLLKG